MQGSEMQLKSDTLRSPLGAVLVAFVGCSARCSSVSIPTFSYPLPPPPVHSHLHRPCPVLSAPSPALLWEPCGAFGVFGKVRGEGNSACQPPCLCVLFPVLKMQECCSGKRCQTWILLSCADVMNFLETSGRG